MAFRRCFFLFFFDTPEVTKQFNLAKNWHIAINVIEKRLLFWCGDFKMIKKTFKCHEKREVIITS